MNKMIDNMDIETKALAKAFVNAALEKGYDMTEIDRIIKEIRKELVSGVSIEAKDEQEFRTKAINFVKSNEELGKEDIAVEMICAMYKLFNLPSIRKRDIVETTYHNIRKQAEKEPSRVEISETYKRLKKFCIVSALNPNYYWKDGLYQYLSKFEFKKNSSKQIVLEIIWAVKHQKI